MRGEKRDHKKTGHIICREERRQLNNQGGYEVMFESRSNNSVFAPESSEGRTAGQGQGADQKSPEGDRHVALQSAHVPDVLLMMQTDNHRACSQEKKGLKKGVGE